MTRAKDNSLKKYENFLCNELNIKMKNKRQGCLLLDYNLVKEVEPPGRPLHNTIISFVKNIISHVFKSAQVQWLVEEERKVLWSYDW